MSSLRRACLCLLLRYYIRADDLDEEDLFDLDGEGDYEDPESYIEYDQALYYDGPDDYYDGVGVLRTRFSVYEGRFRKGERHGHGVLVHVTDDWTTDQKNALVETVSSRMPEGT